MITPQHYLLLSATLFAIGVAAAVVRRHPLVVLLGIELALQAANLAMGALASSFQAWEGRVTTLTLLIVSTAELVVGLGAAIAYARAHASPASSS